MYRPIRIPPHAHPLAKWIIEEANRQKYPLKVLCEKAGIRDHVIRMWGKHVPLITNVEAVANVLGYTLAPTKIKRKSRWNWANNLTRKEREVFDAITPHPINKDDICQELGISPSVLSRRIKSIRRKGDGYMNIFYDQQRKGYFRRSLT